MATGAVIMRFVADKLGSVVSDINQSGDLKFSHIISGNFPGDFKVTGCYYTLYNMGSTLPGYYAVYNQNNLDLNISRDHAKVQSGITTDTNNLKINLANNVYTGLTKLRFRGWTESIHQWRLFTIKSNTYLDLTIKFDILTQKLSTPTNLKLASSVAVVTTPVTLSWNAVANATGNNVTGYDIYRDGSFYKSVGNVTSTSVYCDKLGGSSYFQVLAKGSAGSGYYSGLSGSVTLKAYGKPKAPNLKTINGHTAQYINIGDSITSLPLVWDAVDAPANGVITGYRVYRSYDNWVTWVTLATVNTTSYNASIEGGQNASFAVGAVGSGNVVSGDSRRVYANRISKPTEPIFTEPAAGGYEETLSVKWNETSVANATITYKIQYCIGNEPDINENWKDLTTWISTLSALFYMANAEKGKYIRFRVQARATATHGGYVDSDWGLSTNVIYRYATPGKPFNLILKDVATNKMDFSENEVVISWDYLHPNLSANFKHYLVQCSIGNTNNWETITYIEDITIKSYQYNIKEYVGRGQAVYFQIIAVSTIEEGPLSDFKMITRNSLLKISAVASTISGEQGFPYLNLSFISTVGRYAQEGNYTINIYKSENYKKTLVDKKTIIFSGATIESGLNITIPNLKDVCTDLYNDVIINKTVNQNLTIEIILEDSDFPDAKTIYSSEINLNYGVSPSEIDNLKITLLSSHTDGTIDYANAGDNLKIEYDAVTWKNADNSEIGKNIKYEIRIENIVKTTTDLTEIDMVLEEYGDNTSVLFSVTAYQEYADENIKSSVAYHSFGYARTLNAKEIIVKTVKKSDSLAEGIINIQDLGTSPVWGNFQKIVVEMETNPIQNIIIQPIVTDSHKTTGTINFVLDGLGKDKQELIITLNIYNTSNKIVTTILPAEYVRELLVSLMVRDKFVGVNTSSEYDYNGDKESFHVEGKEDGLESATALFQSHPNNKRGAYLKLLTPGINQNSAEIGFDGENFNFIFNNQKYMVYSTRNKIPVSSLEGTISTDLLEGTISTDLLEGTISTDLLEGTISTDLLEGTISTDLLEGTIPSSMLDDSVLIKNNLGEYIIKNSDFLKISENDELYDVIHEGNFANKLNNIVDITDLITSENFDDITFWHKHQGITVALVNNSTAPTAPEVWGLVITLCVNNDVTQVWYTQSQGRIFRRGGNQNGWYQYDADLIWVPAPRFSPGTTGVFSDIYRTIYESGADTSWWEWLRLSRANKTRVYSVFESNDYAGKLSFRFPYYEGPTAKGTSIYTLNSRTTEVLSGSTWYNMLTTKQIRHGWAATQTISAQANVKIYIPFNTTFSKNPTVQVLCIDTGNPHIRWHANKVTASGFDLTITNMQAQGAVAVTPMWFAIDSDN